MKPTIRCSSFPRLESCPGSLIAASGIITPSAPLATSGEIIHAALRLWARGSTPPTDRMGEREQMIFRWFSSEVIQVEAAHGGEGVRLPEYRIEVDFGAFILTGTFDLLIIPIDQTVHLFDYKTGFLPQTPAPENRQLMTYGVGVVDARPDWTPLYAQLLSAGDPAETRFSRTVYGPEEIAAARDYILELGSAALAAGAPRTPGGHCQYCPALGSSRCPESMSMVTETKDAMITTPVTAVLPSPERCGEIYDAIRAVDRYAAAFLPALKEQIENHPEDFSGIFTLKPGASRRSFSSVEEACNRLIAEGIEIGKIWEAVSLTPAGAERLLKSERSFKGKFAAEYFSNRFGDLVEVKEGSPSLVRV